MEIYSEKTIQLVNTGWKAAADLHSWGPGMRPCYIIHHVRRGAGYLECNRKTYRIEQGESFLITPYEVVHYYPDEQQSWEYEWVDFVGDDAENYLRKLGIPFCCGVLPAVKDEEIHIFFQMLQGMELFHGQKGVANGLLHAILGKYADVLREKGDYTPEKEQNRLATAIMLIHTYYHRPFFHVDTLCEMLQVSRATLYRLFQENLQSAPSRYLLQYRLTQAEKMLEMGVSVKNAALSCGFSDAFYFSKMFKKYRGAAPSAYTASLTEETRGDLLTL